MTYNDLPVKPSIPGIQPHNQIAPSLQEQVNRSKERRDSVGVNPSSKADADRIDADTNGMNFDSTSEYCYPETFDPQMARHGRAISPLCYKPFPTDALPHVLGTFVREQATALGCDEAFIALPLLAVVASAIGNNRVICLKKGWTEPSILWTAIVADSGTLKSPAIRSVVDPLFAIQRRKQAEFAKRQEDHDSEMKRWKEMDEVEKKQHKCPKPIASSPERLVCSDVTIEKLFELLSDNPRGLLLCKDEFNTWLRSFTRYKTGGSGSDMPHWLELYQAGNLTIDRKTGERRTISIEHASVSVCGGIQPTVLAKAMTEEFFESGFVARLLMAMPPKKRKIWRDAVVGEQTLSDYEACLESLLGDSFGQSSNRILNLTEEARGIWITFYNESAVAQADADGAVAAMLSKLEGACIG